jgi:ribonuclease HI
MSFYAVGKGRAPGVYSTWDECKAQTSGFSNAAFKKFKTKAEAEAYVAHYSSDLRKRKSVEAEDDDQDVAGKDERRDKKSRTTAACIDVFTDGNCEGNGKSSGRAGSGVYICRAQGAERIWSRVPGRQTNSRAELFALALALNATLNDPHIRIRPDAQYIVNGVTDPTWLAHWAANNWTKHGKKEKVKNVDLWNLIHLLLAERKRRNFDAPEFLWVKGHAGHAGNEIADKLADTGMAGSPLSAESIAIFPVSFDVELAIGSETSVRIAEKK